MGNSKPKLGIFEDPSVRNKSAQLSNHVSGSKATLSAKNLSTELTKQQLNLQ